MKLSNGCEIKHIGSQAVDGLFFEGEIKDIRDFYEDCRQIVGNELGEYDNRPMTFKMTNRDRQSIFIRFANGRYFVARYIQGIC